MKKAGGQKKATRGKVWNPGLRIRSRILPTYTNPGYGTVKIAQQGSDLTIAINKMDHTIQPRALRYFRSP